MEFFQKIILILFLHCSYPLEQELEVTENFIGGMEKLSTFVSLHQCFLGKKVDCELSHEQSINFHPDGEELGRKHRFKKLLYEQPEDEFNLERFYPKSYNMGSKEDRETFVSYLEREHEQHSLDSVEVDLEGRTSVGDCDDCDDFDDSNLHEVWLMKPGSLKEGRGMSLLDPRNLTEGVFSELKKKSKNHYVKMNYVAQRYVPNPMLYEGRKTSQRIHFLVLSIEPLLVLGYHDFRVIVARDEYTMDDLVDVAIHITNRHQQVVKDKRIGEKSPLVLLGMGEFSENVVGQKDISEESFRDQFFVDSFRIVSYVAKMFGTMVMKGGNREYYNTTDAKTRASFPHFYALYCMDVMLDTDLKVWLLEINWRCYMKAKHPVTKAHNIPLVKEMFIILDEFRRKRNNFESLEDLMNLESLDNSKWEWVVRGEYDFYPDLY